MARRSRDVPQEPGYVPYQPTEARLIHRLAENGEIIAFTDDEYGVRKDHGLGVIKPISSSNGLLFLAILLTAANGWSGLLRRPSDRPGGVGWPTPCGWRSGFRERQIRRERGVPDPSQRQLN